MGNDPQRNTRQIGYFERQESNPPVFKRTSVLINAPSPDEVVPRWISDDACVIYVEGSGKIYRAERKP